MSLVAVLLFIQTGAAGEEHRVANIFRPLATPATAVFHLSMLALMICAAIFVIVGGMLTYTVIRFRRRPGDDTKEPPQVYGSNQIEIAWTVIPLLIVFVLIMVTARVTATVQNAHEPGNALHATIVGHQWWWEIQYPDLGITTANELHIPANEAPSHKPTFLTLESADVIHSFWVPQLAGKTDVIPNRDNHMWIDPSHPGTYLGNCAEYCGTQHANMMLRVVVHPAAEFEQWAANQKQGALTDPQAATGKDVFLAMSCVNCHTVRGTTANGKFGPDLTHLMSRETIGAGIVPNTPENLRAWVKDPQQIKPGNLMPAMHLTDSELDAVVAYLRSLK